MPTNLDHQSNNENDTTETDVYYEALAGQEELYLEEMEETARDRFIAIDEIELRNGC